MRPGGGFEASFWGLPFRVFAPSEITALDVVVQQEIMAQRHGGSFRAVGDANLMRSSAVSQDRRDPRIRRRSLAIAYRASTSCAVAAPARCGSGADDAVGLDYRYQSRTGVQVRST